MNLDKQILSTLDNIIRSKQFCLNVGGYHKMFEEEFAKFVGAKYAVAVSSGTVALELVLRYVGRSYFWSDLYSPKVLIPEFTVPMVRWAAQKAGYEVILGKVDEDFLLRYEELVEYGSILSAVVLVDTAGILNEKTHRIKEFCLNKGITLIEDASHAHGALYKGSMAGTFGDYGVFSFYGTKVLTSGEGGMIVINNEEAVKWMKIYANAGKERGSGKVIMDGYNMRMTEMQAVLGWIYTLNANDVIAERQEIADIYNAAGLKSVQGSFNGLLPSWYRYTIRVKDADKFEALVEENVLSVSGRTHGPNDVIGGKWKFETSNLLSNTHVNLPLNVRMAKEICPIILDKAGKSDII